MLLPYVPTAQICPSNARYMPNIPITSCADIRQLCQYIFLKNTHHIAHVSLHFHCSLHTDPKIAARESKIQ